MKLNSLVCLKNNHLTPLIDGLEESPALAVSVVNDFCEFQKDFNNYNLNYLLFLLTGNPELKEMESKTVGFILKKLKEYENIIPIVILPFRWEKGTDISSALMSSNQIVSKSPLSLILNMNGSVDNPVYGGKTVADVYKIYNEKIQSFLN